jgi:hypothetical protein
LFSRAEELPWKTKIYKRRKAMDNEIEQQDEVEEESPEAPRKSKKWIIIGAVLIIFLAAAAFLGARLLKPQNTTQGFGGKNGDMVISSKGGPGGAKSVRIEMTPASEIPSGRPDANGLFVRREDQSIFIGTGNIRMSARPSSSGPSEVNSSYDGPVVEVVVTHQTQLYQDTTEMPEPDQAQNGVIVTQQIVKPGSLDDLGANTSVTVWGDKQGDRYIARVIVYR